MNDPLLESYHVFVFIYYAFDHFSYDIYADVSSFSSISGKIRHVASSKPDVFDTYWSPMGYQYVDLSKS